MCRGFAAAAPFRFFAEAGGLLAYGVDLSDNFRRVALYADRILKGEKPGDLPVQGPVEGSRSKMTQVGPRHLMYAVMHNTMW
jgi:ABC-type uncharacterized transport system substrate-binding protein